jgi:bifunctional ADP-heptose synthase (sugar kinase/adenylyltransferase)
MRVFNRMAPERLAEILSRFPRLRVAVIGDFFLDKYLDVEPALAEVSVETGKVAHQVVGIRHSPGAAGTIVSNLSALGAGTLHAVGLIGDDGEAFDLCRDLAALRCSTAHLHKSPERMTCTYLKPRDRTDPTLSGEHSRYDTKNRSPASAELQRRLMDSLDALLSELDAVIVMDQVEARDHGAITGAVREYLADAARRYPKVIFWADSRRRIREFRGLVIKPNQFEAVGHENPVPGDEVALEAVVAAIPALQAAAADTGTASGTHGTGPASRTPAVFVTRGPDGMVAGGEDGEIAVVPGVRLEGPLDPTGAGDSATAGAVLGLAAGATVPEAALLGNLVASITVQQLATTGTARPDQLPPRLALWQAQQGP